MLCPLIDCYGLLLIPLRPATTATNYIALSLPPPSLSQSLLLFWLLHLRHCSFMTAVVKVRGRRTTNVHFQACHTVFYSSFFSFYSVDTAWSYVAYSCNLNLNLIIGAHSVTSQSYQTSEKGEREKMLYIAVTSRQLLPLAIGHKWMLWSSIAWFTSPRSKASESIVWAWIILSMNLISAHSPLTALQLPSFYDAF